MIRRLFTLLVFTFSGFYSSFAQETMPVDYTGSWSGSVVEEDYGSYAVTVKLNSVASGNVAGKINYTTLGCGGDLTFLKTGVDEQGTPYAEFLETIRYGNGKCIDNGHVFFFRKGDKLRFLWQHNDYPDSEAAAEMTKF
jgi:hypothetical protein